VRLSEERVARAPQDADARYELGSSVALLASYSATVEGKVCAGFKAARRAYNEHEEVLKLAPLRKDAALTVGTYRYIVSALSMPIRMLAYVAGFGGGKERGIQMIRDAAGFESHGQAEARFALVLIYNREKRYREAIDVLRELEQEYPRNRLLWLEEGSTALRGGLVAEAEASLTRGLSMLPGDSRPRAFGEEAIWHYKLGATQVALGKADAARGNLRKALETEARDWVRGRVHLELGKLEDLSGNRVAARAAYDRALALGRADSDPTGVAEAERLKRSGFRRQ
jgi:tetratricopeptide (TPR) repeat protein